MQNKGFPRALITLALLLPPVAFLLWSFPPYEICVRYYANEASASMGNDAVAYAEGLCDKKIRFWK